MRELGKNNKTIECGTKNKENSHKKDTPTDQQFLNVRV